MRPDRLLVPQQAHRSFDLRHEKLPFFTNSWHFHPEIELNYVVSSTGIRFIGHSVERFTDGEIILLGSNLPHFWKNDATHTASENKAQAEAIIARFMPYFGGKPFWELPETKRIEPLLNRASVGLKLLEPLRSDIASQLRTLVNKEGLQQLTALLHILDQIAQSDAIVSISPGYVPRQQLARQSERLSRVVAYLHDHFTEPIRLEEMADIASMNPASFCRYFRTQTHQTLTQFVTDLRIRYACELLTRSDVSITEVGEQAGFENVSHFVQTFRRLRQQTPALFRRQIAHSVPRQKG